MKTLYLILKQYSRFFLRELIIMLQIMYLLFAITMCASPISYSLSTSRSIEKSIHQNAVYLSAYGRVESIIQGNSNHSKEERQRFESTLNKGIGRIDKLVGQGTVTQGLLQFSNDGAGGEGCSALLYNDDMIRYTSLPLSEGRWLYSAAADEPIPVVLGGPVKESYRIGDQLEGFYSAVGSDGAFTGRFVVAGKLGYGDLYFNFSSFGGKPDLEVLARRNEAGFGGAQQGENIVILPTSAIPDDQRGRAYSSRFLFLQDGENQQKAAEHFQQNYGDFGVCHTISSVFANQTEQDLKRVNTYVILTGVLFVLCIFGLGGYTLLTLSRKESILGIYFQCGMSKRRMAFLTIIPNFILLFIPMLLLSIVSPSFVDYQSGVAGPVYAISAALVTIIFLSSCLLAVHRARRLNPISMIEKERS